MSLGLECENNRFSSLFAAEDVSRETFPAAKSEEQRMFSQATLSLLAQLGVPSSKQAKDMGSLSALFLEVQQNNP